MSTTASQHELQKPSLEFHLLGRVDYGDCLRLQHRLVYEAGGRDDGRIDVLMCEHASLITVGRAGSRGDIRFSREELRRRQLSVQWSGRGGGAVLHMPGQLAIYPVVPLGVLGWTVGDYLRRLQAAVLATLSELRVATTTAADTCSLSGRSGLLAAVGVAVRHGVTFHGAFLNVAPSMQNYGYVNSVPSGGSTAKSTMGCLVAERRRPVTMSQVRSILLTCLAESFAVERYHLHMGHPLLSQPKSCTREPLAPPF